MKSEVFKHTCVASGCPAPFDHGVLPDWIKGKELDPGSGAYEELDPVLRACLKSQISLLHKIWSPAANPGGNFRSIPGVGTVCEECLPQDWAIFILAERYASPAGFVAALLPALMSGVKNIYIWRQGARAVPLHPSISAAMELLGLEEIYGLAVNECGALFWRLVEHTAPGRSSLVLLGNVESSEDYLALAQERDIRHQALPERVKIGLSLETERERLNWLHPGAVITSISEGAAYDAVIAEHGICCAGETGKYAAPLIIAPEHAYFWLWLQLDPAAFQYREFVIVSN